MDVVRRIKGTEDAAEEAAAMAEFNEKKWVWIPDPIAGYLAAWIVSSDAPDREKQTVEVVIADTAEHRTLPSTSIHPLNPPKFDFAEDIADLTHLNEAGVVDDLRMRYVAACGVEEKGGAESRWRRKSGKEKGGIYTYSGLFLISLNPYTPLPIYTPQIVASYRNKRRDELAPHIYAIAERAWCQMGEEGECQSVLITGESGAGKTENTKKVIQYLAAIAPSQTLTSATKSTLSPSVSSGSIAPRIGLPRTHSFRGKSDAELESQDELGLLEKQILQCNPILEAFGNAQTTRNNNSSRFGKFIRIAFTRSGSIVGANVDWYLLEKSRVTARAEAERSFHVFYQLLAAERATDLREKLLLTNDPQDYAFLNKSRTTIDGVNDVAEWKLLKTALVTVGFSADEQFDLFRILSAILHIGNIEFKSDSSDQAMISTNDVMEKVCHLLGVSVKDFTRAVLRPTVKAGREIVTQQRTRRQAEDELAALCKTMYEKTFGSIVERINKALDRPEDKSLFIGVLDIAGFEIFALNGYEQLLINFTNERLQQFFNHHMFVLEQEEYSREGIEWNYVNFGLDLQPTIELIEANHPIGILSTLDEECIMPKATDATFLSKLQTEWEPARGTVTDAVHPGTTKFSTPRFGTGFIVQHYAGPVEYDVNGWLQKNKDPINDNVARLLSSSDITFVGSLFADYADTTATGITGNKLVKRGAFRTVAQRHRQQLTSLMTQLQSTQPHFVRCIVPNSNKTPGRVDVPLVLDQLRCNGVLEGIRIARLGYPNRLPFVEFRQRYEVLTPDVIPKGYIEGRKACLLIIQALGIPSTAHKTGLTKIFFKAGVLASLEERRDSHLFDIFSRFQADARMFIARRRLKRVLNRAVAVRTIQRNARVYLKLRDWPWWQLYTKLQPMLEASRQDEELARRKAELLLAAERATRDSEEKAKMQELQSRLEADKRQAEESLSAERQLATEKDALLARSKQTEVELQEEIEAMKGDLDELAEQLESAEANQLAADARFRGLQQEYDLSVQRMETLGRQGSDWQQKAAKLSEQLLATHQELQRADKDKISLNEALSEAKRKATQLEDDLERSRDKLEAARKLVDSKLEEERALRISSESNMTTLRIEMRTKDERVAALTATAADLDARLRKKQEEITQMQTGMGQSKRDAESALAGQAELKAHIQTLDREKASVTGERDANALAIKQLQGELDSLRRSMVEKVSQERFKADLDKSKDLELGDLRSKLDAATKQVVTDRQSSASVREKLETNLEDARRQNTSLARDCREAQSALALAKSRLTDLSASAAAFEEDRRDLQSQLAEIRSRQIATDGHLAEAIKEKAVLEKQVQAAQAKLADYEDAVLALEREKSDWVRKIETAAMDLRSETAKREQLERKTQAASIELGQARAFAEQAQHDLAQATLAIEARDADIAVLKSRENKTVVEHVHVLEKAKRLTDRELAETRQEKDRLVAIVRSFDNHRARSSAEHEELVRQHELIKAELGREKQASKILVLQANDVQAEQVARRAAEAARMEAVRSHKAALTQISRLEEELTRAHDAAQAMSSAAPRKDAAPTRLLQELRLNNEQLRNEMDEQLGRGRVPSDGIENSRPPHGLRSRKPTDQIVLPGSLPAASTGDDSAAIVKQQLLSLDAHMTQSDRIRQHLLMQIEEVTRDLEASDGSRASLEAAREKLRQRNRELAVLLQSQQKQQQTADAQNVASIQDIWKSFKSHMQDERTRYSALDSSKRDLLATYKLKTSEVEDLTARLKDTDVRIKRLQSQPNQEKSKSARVERQSASELSDNFHPTILELESELISQKTLSETHLARAESAEVAKQRAEREASILRSDLQRLSKQIEETAASRDKKAELCAALDKRIRAMEAHAEDREVLNSEVINAEVQKLLEKERGRYHKDLQDRDFTIGQTRAKYQGELAQLSEEQGQLRDELSSAKEEARLHKANAEALRLKLDEDSHELSSWKLSRDRDESRIVDLTKALESATADCTSTQAQNITYLDEIRELRGKLDEVDAECTALRHTKSKLEQRINESFENQLNASRFSRDQAVQQLTVDKQELQTSLDAMTDQLALAKQRAAKSDANANEKMEELSAIRTANAELDKQNSSLQKTIKDLNVRIVDLTTQSYANSPRQPQQRLEQKVRELQARVERETQERSEAQRLHRAVDRSSREYKAQLDELLQEREKLKEDSLNVERALLDAKEMLSETLIQKEELSLLNKRQERAMQDLTMKLGSFESGSSRSLYGTLTKDREGTRTSFSSPRRGGPL